MIVFPKKNTFRKDQKSLEINQKLNQMKEKTD